jgi:hypothetical protein
MTPVRVRVLARFFKSDEAEGMLQAIVPDFVLVEVVDGPAKGGLFWAPKFAVRVPGVKPRYFQDLKIAAHVGQVVADITPRIAHKNVGVARLTL